MIMVIRINKVKESKEMIRKVIFMKKNMRKYLRKKKNIKEINRNHLDRRNKWKC